MRKMRLLAAICGCALLAIMATSCSFRPTLYPVRGKVVYRERSLKGAVVVFHPADSKRTDLPSPRGVLDQDGSFELSTYIARDGAPAGRYKVTVSLELIPQGGERDDSYIASPSQFADFDSTELMTDIPRGGGELPPLMLDKEPTGP